MRALLAAALAIGIGADVSAVAQPPSVDGAAFEHPRGGLGESAMRRFAEGRQLFRQPWVVGPSHDHPELQGLGPLHNRLSCIACHVKNGRAAAPADGDRIRTMVVRLGVDGRDEHDGPRPHPIYGGQFNPEGIEGGPGEGTVRIRWHEQPIACGDEMLSLRRPSLEFSDLAYGPLGDGLLTSLRNAPPVFGLGDLEAVPEAQLRAIAAENGGRLNEVWDIRAERKSIGRFGLKANQPSLRQQNANAFVEDLGITSPLFPHETCTAAQTACAAVATAGEPELSAARLFAVTAYVADLAVPPRRDLDSPEVARGDVLFGEDGCRGCHRPVLTTAGGEVIRPYTDLLLHDMGEGLADGRADHGAGPRDWRTAPLWGVGLAGRIGDGGDFLHDGRARSFAEAIVWHGGEAAAAAERFCSISGSERRALLAFLSSL